MSANEFDSSVDNVNPENFRRLVDHFIHFDSCNSNSAIDFNQDDHQKYDSQKLQPNTLFGHFLIVDLIGKGGFGEVYGAISQLDGSLVALKIPRNDRAYNQEVIKRFKREAILTQRVNHPNIVPIHSHGVINKTVYIATVFQSGPDLRKWMQENRGEVETERVIAWGIELLDALQHAFENGVVHRDLKPSNIIITKLNHEESIEKLISIERPKITDFGLACSINDFSDQSSSYASMVGTLSYMAPEQFLEPETRKDIRGDIYSLAIILIELLLDRPLYPFRNQFEILLRLTRSERIHCLKPLRRRISKVLLAVLAKATETNPSLRYATPAEFKKDLVCFLTGKETLAKPKSVAQLALATVRGNPLFSLFVLFSSLYLGFFLFNEHQNQINLILINQKLKESNNKLMKSYNLLKDSEINVLRQSYYSMIRKASVDYYDKRYDACQESLDQAYRLDQKSGLNMIDYSWKMLNAENMKMAASHKAANFDIYINGDKGKVLREIYEINENIILENQLLMGHIYDTRNGVFFLNRSDFLLMEKPLMFNYKKNKTVSSYSSNSSGTEAIRANNSIIMPSIGTCLDFNAEGVILNENDTPSRALEKKFVRTDNKHFKIPLDFLSAMPSLSANGQYLIGLSRFVKNGTDFFRFYCFDLLSTRVLEIELDVISSESELKDIIMPSISQNGKLMIIFQRRTNEIQILSLPDGRVIHRMEYDTQARPLALAVDDSTFQFVVADSSKRIKCWNIGNDNISSVLPREIDSVSQITVASGGNYWIRSHYSDRVWVWNPHDDRSGNISYDINTEVWSLDFDPQGDYLSATGDDASVNIWNLKDHSRIKLNDHSSLVTCGKFSTNGRYFASVDFAGYLVIRNTKDWSIIRKMSIDKIKFRTLQWAPNDEELMLGGDDSNLWIINFLNSSISKININNRIYDSVFLRSSKCLVISNPGNQSKLIILSYPDQKIIRTVPLERRPLRLTKSNDEKLIAVGFQEGGFLIYDFKNDQIINDCESVAVRGPVSSLLFTPDSKNLLVAGSDNIVHIFETTNWESITNFKSTASRTHAFAISTDLKSIASGDMSGKIKLYSTFYNNN